MKKIFLLFGLPVLLIGAIFLFVSVGSSNSTTDIIPVNTGNTEPEEIGWDALIPPEWRVESLFEGIDFSNMEDDDPRAEAAMSKLKELAEKSPIVPGIEGKHVKIPGYLVPVELGTDEIFEFLLVPYYGACIHVPPPPLNQTIYVKTAKNAPYRGELFDTVWVNGVIRVERVDNEIGSSGYTIIAIEVTRYTE